MASRQTNGQPPCGELHIDTLRTCRETHPGIGQHPTGGWPGEPSLLVPGTGLEEARELAATFEQNAFLWSDGDAVPRLILTGRM